MKNGKHRRRSLTSLACALCLMLSLTPGAAGTGLREAEPEIPAAARNCKHGQNPGWWSYQATPASCTEEGRSYRVCTHCGLEETLSTTPMNPHSWERKTEEATGSKSGRVYQVCRICGKKEELSTLPAKLHSGSGSTQMEKLSQREIARLLREAPAPRGTAMENVYDALPTPPYDAGRVKDAALQTALNRLNLFRRLAGLPSVSLDEELCGAAQWGALLLAAEGQLNRTPVQPAGMGEESYQKGLSALSAANTASGCSLAEAVDAWMEDSEPASLSRVGHRSWQMNPTLGKVGFGIAEGYAVEVILDRSGEGCPYDYLAWPASGNFPSELFEKDAGWSVYLNPETYAAPVPEDLTVTLSSGHRTWTLRGEDSYDPEKGGKFLACDVKSYGDAGYCLIFRPDGVKAYEGAYTVEIEGLRDKDGFSSPLSYQVTFFRASGVTAAGAQRDPFTDVPYGSYCYDAVRWALEEGVTQGATAAEFQPAAPCTRGQAVTFLWRAMDCPAAENPENPFLDVPESSPYRSAILWAREKGITAGVSETSFQPDAPCANEQVITFLWRCLGEPESRGGSDPAAANPGRYSANALAWADSHGILEGKRGETFDPLETAVRGNIMNYLYRSLGQ